MHYLYLAVAIVSEVIATSALKACNQFTQFGPSVAVVIGYCSSFYFLTLTLKSISVGIAYAIWSGVGIVLIAMAGAIIYQQSLDLPAVIGMGFIIGGVAIISLFSQAAVH